LRIRNALLCVFALSVATQGQGEATPRSPLFGTWVAEVARLPVPAESRPRSVTIVFSELEGGRLGTTVEVVDANGMPMRAEGTTSLDGKPSPVSGNLEADASATTMPAENVLVMQLATGGVPASTRVYVVSDDGESMVETSAYVGGDGQPVLRINYFQRSAPEIP
jgi:hypothetical protein